MEPFKHSYPFDPSHGYTLEQLLAMTPPEEPVGFADFWKATYAEATASVPPYTTREIWSPLPNGRLFEIRTVSYGGVPVTLWISRPEKSHGAIVWGQGYGNGVWPISDPDFTSCIVGVRGLGPSTQRDIPWDVQKHVLHGIESKETYVWRGIIADMWVSLSILLDLFPDCADNVNFRGGSMGGAIGALGVPWDHRFRTASLDVPTFGHHPVRATLPCAGSGKALGLHCAEHPESLDVLAFFDAAIAAKYLRVPTICSPAKFDPLVQPPGQFAVANAIPRDMADIYVTEAGHFAYPEETPLREKIDRAIQRLFRRPGASMEI